MSEVRVWVNGALVAADQPAIAAIDHGVTVGDGAFETCKIVEGHAFAMSRHLARMDRTLAGLGLAAADHDRVREGAHAVLAAGDPISFGRLRWTITGGIGPLGSDRLDSALTYVVTAGAVAPPPPTVQVVTVPWVRNERAATAGLKTTSYAENVIALARAKRHDATEAIFGNTRGDLCEGTGSNIFVVRDGVVSTPPVVDGPLAGITRELVLQWGREAGVDIREETMQLSVLQDCDEIFLTSSLKDVRPVTRCDDRELSPGPVTRILDQVWRTKEVEGIDP
ncbi:aminotransferase class IV [Phycicoccus elongatus]|uniref:aminotransferase class IV n=1 Tax=Phycicoccus elongatus TaxID=101689 RepID=UPI003785254D